jgi:hypothetical protein
VKDRFERGIVPYTDGGIVPFGAEFYAVPFSLLWDKE